MVPSFKRPFSRLHLHVLLHVILDANFQAGRTHHVVSGVSRASQFTYPRARSAWIFSDIFLLAFVVSVTDSQSSHDLLQASLDTFISSVVGIIAPAGPQLRVWATILLALAYMPLNYIRKNCLLSNGSHLAWYKYFLSQNPLTMPMICSRT